MKPSLYPTAFAFVAIGQVFGHSNSSEFHDQKAAAQWRASHLAKLRVRDLLAPRADCHTIDCSEGGNDICSDKGCGVCGWQNYCTVQNEKQQLPKIDQMVIVGNSSDIPGKPKVLTNFLEGRQLEDNWADIICAEATNVPSDQDVQAGSFYHSIQGTHKRAMSLTHEGEFLTMLVTWAPSNKRLLPLFESMKKELCKKAMNEAARHVHTLRYGFWNGKSVRTVKNRHHLQIQTPPTGPARLSKRGRTGNTIALINIELGDHNKDVELFKGNGLPAIP